jgi:hypothetical protein
MRRIILSIFLVVVLVFMPFFCCETSSTATTPEHHIGQAISPTSSHKHSNDSDTCVCCSGAGAISKIESYNSLLHPRFYAVKANISKGASIMAPQSAPNINTSFLVSESPPAVPFYIQINSLLI